MTENPTYQQVRDALAKLEAVNRELVALRDRLTELTAEA